MPVAHQHTFVGGYVASPTGADRLSEADFDEFIRLIKQGDRESISLALSYSATARRDAKLVAEMLGQIADLPTPAELEQLESEVATVDGRLAAIDEEIANLRAEKSRRQQQRTQLQINPRLTARQSGPLSGHRLAIRLSGSSVLRAACGGELRAAGLLTD